MSRSPWRTGSPRHRRGAVQMVLVMLVMLVVGAAVTGAVRRSVAMRRMDQHRDRSLMLDRMLHAAQQWTEAGGEVGGSAVTLRLPTRSAEPAAVILRRLSDDQLQLTATLSREGRSIATRSRVLDLDAHDGSQ